MECATGKPLDFTSHQFKESLKDSMRLDQLREKKGIRLKNREVKTPVFFNSLKRVFKNICKSKGT